MIKLVIPGKPLAKQRARTVRCKGFSRTYTPDQTVKAETLVKQLFIQAHTNHVPSRGPVEIFVRAFFPIPASASKGLRTRMEQENVPYLHRSDWDNIGKLPSDALSSLAYHDDCQIFHADVYKLYSPRPRVEIDLVFWDDPFNPGNSISVPATRVPLVNLKSLSPAGPAQSK